MLAWLLIGCQTTQWQTSFQPHAAVRDTRINVPRSYRPILVAKTEGRCVWTNGLRMLPMLLVALCTPIQDGVALGIGRGELLLLLLRHRPPHRGQIAH
eukprot:11523959-Alexandrium_andersonii.AAC.1